MADLTWLIPAFPLAGFLIILVFGRRLGDPKAGYLAATAVFASFVATVAIYFDLLARTAEERTTTVTLWSWIPVDTLQIDMAFTADTLSITMCLFVTGIAFLIHLFAVGYMQGDPKFSKFFLYLNLFVLAMTVLVLGENLLVTFLGWEGVGVCSYFLISFWQTRESAATAGKKAFLTNRVGDWGFMIAMFLGFQAVGSVSYSVLDAGATSGAISQNTATAMVLMLLVGAVGKSAQLPLYIWLPDAMEGPTPVSALIHAATMVTAGVFLLTRANPILHAADPNVMVLIAWVGAFTAFMAATIAIPQTDIKKVLAYSTISQLGYMFLAIGSGAYIAAIFHMITHAFFKALLFLGSGSVINGMHHEQDMRKMGALRKVMPVTAFTFIIGWLAIAGVPPFAGFWSKDEILLYTLAERGTVLYVIGLVAALMTAYYMTRQVIMVFFGKAHWESLANADEAPADQVDEASTAHGEFKPHESPPIMLFPLVVLAFGATFGGMINLPSFSWIPHNWTHKLGSWLHPVVHVGEAEIEGTWAYDHKGWLAILATVIALAGIGLAYLVYGKKKLPAVEPKFFYHGWYYNWAITWFMGGPGRALFSTTAEADRVVVDGAVNGVAEGVAATGKGASKLQTGNVRNYTALIGLAAVVVLAWFLFGRGVL